MTKEVVQKEEKEATAKAEKTQAIADDAQRDLDEALPMLVSYPYMGPSPGHQYAYMSAPWVLILQAQLVGQDTDLTMGVPSYITYPHYLFPSTPS